MRRKHWSLAILSLLRERPMHPYEMRRQIRERHKEDRLVLKPGSLYNAIEWLARDGLIRARETVREGSHPPRTTYELTPPGEQSLLAWLGEMLAEPHPEGSSFSVALDHLVQLDPAAARQHLTTCRQRLGARIAGMESLLSQLRARLKRISVIEIEHDLALCRAEAKWIDGVLRDLADKSFRWQPPRSGAVRKSKGRVSCVPPQA